MATEELEAFCAAYHALEADGVYGWEVFDEALLEICKKYPCHTSHDEVFAKVAIVNRAYRANLHLYGKGIEDEVAKVFVKEGLDGVLSPLGAMTSLTSQNLPELLAVHRKVVGFVRRITKRTCNSFASKYLHFHCPDLVPIFDKYAYGRSWILAPVPRAKWRAIDKHSNYHYAYHCTSVVSLLEELRGRGVRTPRVKLVDVLLYSGTG